MPKLIWMLTKTTTQNQELGDGPPEDSCLIQMPWTCQWEEQGEELQDQKRSTTMHLHICPKEDSCKEEGEEEDVPNKI